MKRNLSLLLSLLFAVLCLSGCGGGASSASVYGSAADYAPIISGARSEDQNQALPIITSPEDDQYDLVFGTFGADDSAMQRYAVSVSPFIVKAYGVAIILPVEGHQQEVLDAVNAFVESQKKAQENYLPDQYAIASGALVRVADTGEVLLAMCEEPAEMMAALEAGLDI